MIEVRTHSDPFSGTTQIAFMKYEGNRLYVAEPMQLVFKEVGETEPIEPTLKIERRLADQILQELSNGLNKAGYRSELIEGYKLELGAVNKHLEDMRALVFKEKPNVSRPIITRCDD